MVDWTENEDVSSRGKNVVEDKDEDRTYVPEPSDDDDDYV
jgi:hypothetical protein